MCVSPPASELLILITLVPLTHWSGPVWSLVMRFVQSTAWSHEGRGVMLQKCLALYLISRGFHLDEGEGRATQWDAQSPKPETDINNKPTQLQAPVWQRWIHPVKAMPTWKWEVKKQICAACQPTASFNSVGCRKGRKNPHCLQGMTHMVHNGSLSAVCNQCTHSVWRVFCLCCFYQHQNAHHTLPRTLNSGISAEH